MAPRDGTVPGPRLKSTARAAGASIRVVRAHCRTPDGCRPAVRKVGGVVIISATPSCLRNRRENADDGGAVHDDERERDARRAVKHSPRPSRTERESAGRVHRADRDARARHAPPLEPRAVAGEQIEDALAGQRRGVERTAIGERDARGEKRHEGVGNQQASELVRDVPQPPRVDPRKEQCRLEPQNLNVAGERPDLAARFGVRVGRRDDRRRVRSSNTTRRPASTARIGVSTSSRIVSAGSGR